MAKKIKAHNEQYNNIVVGVPGYEFLTESYNRLKDNILYLNVDGKAKVIQFVSALPTEGKTVTATNLAACLATNGKKVLVVDGDLRAPRAYRTLKVSNDIGIADYMLSDTNINDIIQHTSYGVDLISRGKKIENSSAVIASDKFKNLISNVKDQYDYIIIDCPPVLEISDYIHISTTSDGVILCVAFGQTKKGQVKEAVKLLKQANIKILGTVYTFVDSKAASGRYGYSYGYGYGYNKYGYYHHSSDENSTSEDTK